MATRKAASVLPEPVGAEISVSRPAMMCGQPRACASVGALKRRSNQARTAGWKESRTFMTERERSISRGPRRTSVLWVLV